MMFSANSGESENNKLKTAGDSDGGRGKIKSC